jgi:uncharacterized protein involved in exopolysaccharide biosynthesis
MNLEIQEKSKRMGKKPNLNQDDSEASILDILIKIFKEIKIIIIITFLCCFVAFIKVQFFSKPMYISSSKIMSSPSNNETSQAVGLAAQFGLNLKTSNSGPNWAYSEIIKSRVMVKKLLNRKFNTKEFGLNKSLFFILTDGQDQVGMDIEKVKTSIVDILIKTIGVSKDLKTSIITLTVEAKEPKLALDINNAIIENLDTFQKKYNKKKNSEAKTFIQQRIVKTEEELQRAEENLKNFRDRNRRIENSPSLQLEESRLLREVSVLIGVFTTLKQQYETTKIEEVKESDYVFVLDDPSKPSFRSKPNKRKTMVLSFFFGILISLVYVFIKDFITNSKKEDLKKINTLKSLLMSNTLDLLKFKLRN